jgi:hypothetical protein
MEIRRRRRLQALFQRREDATAAAHAIEDRGEPARVADAGRLEDAAMARRTFRGAAIGALIGVVAGVIVGLAVMATHGGSGGPAVMAIAIVGLAAFGTIGGSQFGAAAAEATRSSGQAMAVVADVEADDEPAAQETLREHGAATISSEES